MDIQADSCVQVQADSQKNSPADSLADNKADKQSSSLADSQADYETVFQPAHTVDAIWRLTSQLTSWPINQIVN